MAAMKNEQPTLVRAAERTYSVSFRAVFGVRQ